MITLQDKQAFSDLSIIFTMMPKSMISKINTKFVEFIEKNKDINYISNINPSIPLKEQNIQETTEALLAVIYRDYLCDKEERDLLIKKEYSEAQNNDNEKYTILFKNNHINKTTTNENTSLIPYNNENIILKIINKIKKLFS